MGGSAVLGGMQGALDLDENGSVVYQDQEQFSPEAGHLDQLENLRSISQVSTCPYTVLQSSALCSVTGLNTLQRRFVDCFTVSMSST